MRDLGLHHQQPVSLCDALDRVLHTGVVALGEVTISVADVDLLYLGLQLVITSIETGQEPGGAGEEWPKPGRVLRGGAQAQWGAAPGPERRLQPALDVQCSPRPQGVQVRSKPAQAGAQGAVPGCLSPGAAPEKNGLGQLVLALIRLLHELLKRQAVRRMEAGSLSIAEMERLGVTLMRQAQEIERMAKDLGLELDDLNLDLGPLGRLL